MITTFRYTSDWQAALLACFVRHSSEFEPCIANLESGNVTGNISQVVAKLVMSWHGHVWECNLKAKMLLRQVSFGWRMMRKQCHGAMLTSRCV